MATNLSLDPALIERSLQVSGERTKKAAVTGALQEFIARRRQKRLIDLMGKLEWDHSFDFKAERSRKVTLLVDTSVWSLALRRDTVPGAGALSARDTCPVFFPRRLSLRQRPKGDRRRDDHWALLAVAEATGGTSETGGSVIGQHHRVALSGAMTVLLLGTCLFGQDTSGLRGFGTSTSVASPSVGGVRGGVRRDRSDRPRPIRGPGGRDDCAARPAAGRHRLAASVGGRPVGP